MDDATPARGPSPRRFASALMGLLHGHLALFSEELKEQQNSTVRLLVFASLALLFGILLIIGLSAALLIYFWDSARFSVVLGLCLLYAAGFLIFLVRLLMQLHNAVPPFKASLEELARDREQLLP
nr:phage holin family protein [uncultured Pseudomonas sp.]